MEVYLAEKYGSHMAQPSGWIVELGEDEYHHKFGGESWQVIDPRCVYGGPTLLLSLNLNDPKLRSLQRNGIHELPMCSYVNCDAWTSKQIFQINPKTQSVILIGREKISPKPLDEEDKFPSPILEKKVRLRSMKDEEYPTSEELYWQACDDFVGGAAFIRVLGPPLWMQWVEREICSCGLDMEYVCSIGYESYSEGYLDSKPFFIGEGALYFFLCSTCLKEVVIFQAT